MTRAGWRIVKLLIGVVLGILLSEAVLRWTPRVLLPKEFRILDRVYTARGAWQDMMMGDRYVGYKLRPNLDIGFPSEGRSIPIHTTNYGLGDIGFRDIGTRPPFAGIAVGDSFTLCDDVPPEACWVRHLADATGLSIATLGVNGYSNLAEQRILDRYGRQLNPRLILVGVFPNDYKDNVNFDRWTRSGTDNFWIWLGLQRGRGQLGRWFADHSMLYRIIDAAMRSRGRNIKKFKNDTLDYVFRFDQWWLHLARHAERDPGFHLMQQALLGMRATANEIGAQLVVILFPTKEQVYWDIARQYARDTDKNIDVDHPLQVIGQFCAANDIAYCDLSDAVRAEAQQGRQLYLRISSHWNDAGNAVGAQAIGRCLTEKGLLTLARQTAPQDGTPQ